MGPGCVRPCFQAKRRATAPRRRRCAEPRRPPAGSVHESGSFPGVDDSAVGIRRVVGRASVSLSASTPCQRDVNSLAQGPATPPCGHGWLRAWSNTDV